MMCHPPINMKDFKALLSVFAFLFIIPTFADELDNLISSHEAIKIAGGFRFTEGPVADKSGNVFFSDIPTSKTYKWNADTGKVSVARENTHEGNGMRMDKNGIRYTCEHASRSITATLPNGEVITVVNAYEGKKLNSPNDLWFDPKGGIYFTDPRYGKASNLEQDGFHVYYKFPQSSRVIRVCDDLVKPNGIIGTPDGKQLYVADLGDRKTYVYKINGDATLTHKKLFAELGSDGMSMDSDGNLYLTSGAVHIISPQGKRLGQITTPESPANVTFGGKDMKTLFITARTSLYAIRMKVTGQ